MWISNKSLRRGFGLAHSNSLSCFLRRNRSGYTVEAFEVAYFAYLIGSRSMSGMLGKAL